MAFGCTHSKYGPENERLYSLESLDSQNQEAFLLILSALFLSSGKVSFFKNSTRGSIQLGPALTLWTRTKSVLAIVRPYRSSTSITLGGG